MAKVAVFVLALALVVVFVSAHSVVSEQSSNPSIYEQIDKAAEEEKGAVHGATAPNSGKKKEETAASPETAKKNQGDGSSATWGTWIKNKIGGLEGLISGNSQQKPSSAGGPAQAPSSHAGSAKAPSAKSN